MEQFEISDSNFEEISKDLNDSIGGMLANAGIAIAEQKKLLQGAKTPTALQNAVKLIALTTGNLLHASTGMLSWMGKQLDKPYGRQHDSAYTEIYDGALFGELKKIAGALNGGIRRLFSKALGDVEQEESEDEIGYAFTEKSDSSPFAKKSKQGYEVHYQAYGKTGRLYAILFRPNVNDYVVANGYDTLTGEWSAGEYGFSTMSSAVDALNAKIGN